MSAKKTDWDLVEEVGRRLYDISLPGVPVDHEELSFLASLLIRLANEETEGGDK